MWDASAPAGAFNVVGGVSGAGSLSCRTILELEPEDDEVQSVLRATACAALSRCSAFAHEPCCNLLILECPFLAELKVSTIGLLERMRVVRVMHMQF